MPRERRIQTAGFYHISNRGVGHTETFLDHEDRIYFISLLSSSAEIYQCVLHSYALISTGYNFLIETRRNNLSHIMKRINGQYTRYFNHKYKRIGHLWEGRYRAWWIEDQGFLLDIVAYIENLPYHTGNAILKNTYPYATYQQFVGLDEPLACVSDSIVFRAFNSVSDIRDFFDKPVDTYRINRILRC